jgi:pyruvate,water dikinase
VNTAYTSGFHEPACRDPREFGGKAAGLAGLAAAGLPVAPGFAVGVAAYRAFLEFGGVPGPVAAAIRERYRRLCVEVGIADVSVAVRSSATAEDSAAASFAGGFETWVDVAGTEDVLAHVRRCWDSVFSARAVDYARANGVDPAGVEMAVVVQKTVRARSAGVMFTISPVTGDRSRIVIEASWGLGLAVVGGEVTPDRWVVDKVGLTVAERTPGDKRIEYLRGDAAVDVHPARWAEPCLTDEQVLALARLGKRIERGHGCPQDIEFAIDSDTADTADTADVVLLQCRPETVWSTRSHVPKFDAGQGVASWISGAVTGPARESG